MEELDASDMRLIAANHFPAIPAALLEKMIGFARALQRDVVTLRKFGSRGSPWDFNLRDLFRWCELMELEQVGIHPACRRSCARLPACAARTHPPCARTHPPCAHTHSPCAHTMGRERKITSRLGS